MIPRLGAGAKQFVEDALCSELGISDITLLEISMLVSRGRISLSIDLATRPL